MVRLRNRFTDYSLRVLATFTEYSGGTVWEPGSSGNEGRCRVMWASGPRSAGCLASRKHPPQSQHARGMATIAPMSCAAMKAGTPCGAMPANVSDSDRAMVTAGLANDVEAVNQYAEVMYRPTA